MESLVGMVGCRNDSLYPPSALHRQKKRMKRKLISVSSQSSHLFYMWLDSRAAWQALHFIYHFFFFKWQEVNRFKAKSTGKLTNIWLTDLWGKIKETRWHTHLEPKDEKKLCRFIFKPIIHSMFDATRVKQTEVCVRTCDGKLQGMWIHLHTAMIKSPFQRVCEKSWHIRGSVRGRSREQGEC